MLYFLVVSWIESVVAVKNSLARCWAWEVGEAGEGRRFAGSASEDGRAKTFRPFARTLTNEKMVLGATVIP